MGDEFTVSGLTVPRIAIYEGSILVLWGIAAYIISDQSSITAMIPSFMGAPLIILGLLSEKMPEIRHHLMHASMVLALLMVLGGGRVFADFSEIKEDPAFHNWAEAQPQNIQDWIYNNPYDGELAARAITLYKADMGLVNPKDVEEPKTSQAEPDAATLVPTRNT